LAAASVAGDGVVEVVVALTSFVEVDGLTSEVLFGTTSTTGVTASGLTSVPLDAPVSEVVVWADM
jgi:hypothetical protein